MQTEITAPSGTIPAIIVNKEELYEGNLIHYLNVICKYARNLYHPYHNGRHLLHVLWLCDDACRYYADVLTPRQMRNLLIAALFHDFDHAGRSGYDDLNIEVAIRGLRKHIMPEDTLHFENICDIIRPTEYPYTVPADGLSLPAQILRDADVSQALSSAWIQQVIFGLAKESGMSLLKVLEMQEPFLSNLRFTTVWANRKFDEKMIKDKIAEAKALFALLNEN